MGESFLAGRNLITPIASPVDRDNDDITGLFNRTDGLRQEAHGIVRLGLYRVQPGPVFAGRPLDRNAARNRPQAENDDSAAFTSF